MTVGGELLFVGGHPLSLSAGRGRWNQATLSRDSHHDEPFWREGRSLLDVGPVKVLHSSLQAVNISGWVVVAFALRQRTEPPAHLPLVTSNARRSGYDQLRITVHGGIDRGASGMCRDPPLHERLAKETFQTNRIALALVFGCSSNAASAAVQRGAAGAVSLGVSLLHRSHELSHVGNSGLSPPCL